MYIFRRIIHKNVLIFTKFRCDNITRRSVLPHKELHQRNQGWKKNYCKDENRLLSYQQELR